MIRKRTILAAGDQAQLLVNVNQAPLAANSNKFSGTVSSNATSAIIPTQLNGTMTGQLHSAGPAELVGIASLAGGNTTAQHAFGGKRQ